ncbi:MAG: hypothetical protein KIT00_09920 [Rhodospirillales bacterium]|nr:hypothetical protein [Rhodospirillales bacterium]
MHISPKLSSQVMLTVSAATRGGRASGKLAAIHRIEKAQGLRFDDTAEPMPMPWTRGASLTASATSSTEAMLATTAGMAAAAYELATAAAAVGYHPPLIQIVL